MDRHSDVFVIGGDVIGLACAYYLSKEGKRVRLGLGQSKRANKNPPGH